MSEGKSTRSSETGDKYYLNKMKSLRKSNGSNPMDYQVGGHHYKDCGIQPVDYIFKNLLLSAKNQHITIKPIQNKVN